MKMAEKVQAVNEIFLSTTNQEKFLETYGFEALKKVQAKLNSLIENQEEHYKKLAEEEAERLRKEEEEAQAKLQAEIDSLKSFAKLQLPADKQDDEAAIEAKAKELLASLSQPQSVEKPESKPKSKRSYTANQFKTILTDENGQFIVRSLTGKRSQAVKDKINDDEPIWKIVHQDDADKFITYAEKQITYKDDIAKIKAHFNK
ncbi:TPA: hypothetical protein I7145_13305 [Vibrio vulnificus]|nr:hypothetical protein [Vibrio vulnificus]